MDTAILIVLIVLSAISLSSLILCIVLLAKAKKSSATDMTDRLNAVKTEINDTVRKVQTDLYTILSQQFRTLDETQQNKIASLNATLTTSLLELTKNIELRLDAIRTSMDGKMTSLQAENSKKLDEMRGIVDEKLQKTLNDRMSESFKMVSERLEDVYKSIGEMQTLASGVGDLKKILSNVKTRGILGEVQLERILEQILTPEQYDCNVKTKKNSDDPVEFAVKLPSKESDETLYLPIDAKFPLDKYAALTDAYESGVQTDIDKASREFESFIKESAKKIRDKYIDPPHTTPFAIMFLPTEGLYSEVIRRPSLFETVQRDYNVTVTGPSTVTAFLNCLQMGFRTLAIEKRSNEVWQLLAAVKTDFEKFDDALKNVRRRLSSADDDLEKLIGTRSNVIRRRLKGVQELPASEAARILDEPESMLTLTAEETDE